ncbi:MAG: hypothetical protein KatS3mg042_0916 [Rhodothermaceae bacterium]|nr:MAG: hypothetical protein KatS3mg042_0916 [Rhodothermaceae bacterium]
MVLPPVIRAQQTSDPLVSQQQYLFDVHHLDEAWTITTGSSNTSIGVYSMLGFIQNHEDLSSSRLLAPQGGLLVPDLDYASEMAGIVGATTNNGLGMAGIDRAARLQSYSILRSSPSGADEEEPVTFTRDDNTTVTYYLDLRRLSEMLDQGRTSGIDVHLFSFGVPSGEDVDYQLPEPPDTSPGDFPDPGDFTERKNFQTELKKALSRIFGGLCGDPFGIPLTWLIGDCYAPPEPLETFRTAIGNAVALGSGVVVVPAGDLNDALEERTPYLPGMMDKYTVTVGGIKHQGEPGFDLVKWDRTREAPYVDVAGFAENVVGLSGTGTNQYNTSFNGTAAAASIGAGVAALLKAENPNLSGEDIDEILKRTARDVGTPGRDDATGYGAINAGAALAFVRDNDIQRATVSVTQVLSDQSTGEVRRLEGYQNYIPGACSYYPLIQGERREFTARVTFTESFAAIPDVWVRWAGSNGVNTRYKADNGDLVAFYDPFEKDLEVVAVDNTGFTVRGSYWYARFFDYLGRECPTKANIPTSPINFDVAYTAVGTEQSSIPLSASISGPSWLNIGQQGTWTANVSGGEPPYTYRWDYQLLCSGLFGPQRIGDPQPMDVTCDRWHYGGSGSSFSRTTSGNATLQLKLTVTDAVSTSEIAYKTVTVGSGGGGARTEQASTEDTLWMAQSPATVQVGKAEETLPTAYALEAAYPNPFNPTTEIRFALPESAPVSLVIYDVTGREVARLVDGTLAAGYHRVQWEASSMPSGLYLYRLTAGTYTETRRMVLTK